jgi:hypothetical protein
MKYFKVGIFILFFLIVSSFVIAYDGPTHTISEIFINSAIDFKNNVLLNVDWRNTDTSGLDADTLDGYHLEDILELLSGATGVFEGFGVVSFPTSVDIIDYSTGGYIFGCSEVSMPSFSVICIAPGAYKSCYDSRSGQTSLNIDSSASNLLAFTASGGGSGGASSCFACGGSGSGYNSVDISGIEYKKSCSFSYSSDSDSCGYTNLEILYDVESGQKNFQSYANCRSYSKGSSGSSFNGGHAIVFYSSNSANLYNEFKNVDGLSDTQIANLGCSDPLVDSKKPPAYKMPEDGWVALYSSSGIKMYSDEGDKDDIVGDDSVFSNLVFIPSVEVDVDVLDGDSAILKLGAGGSIAKIKVYLNDLLVYNWYLSTTSISEVDVSDKINFGLSNTLKFVWDAGYLPFQGNILYSLEIE